MSAATQKVVVGYLAEAGGGDPPAPYFFQYGEFVPVQVFGGSSTYTDLSDTMTTGSTAQTLAVANADRKGYRVQNLSMTASLFINDTGADAVTTSDGASMTLLPGAYYESPAGGVSVAAISVNGPVTGQAFAAAEW